MININITVEIRQDLGEIPGVQVGGHLRQLQASYLGFGNKNLKKYQIQADL